MTAKPVMTDKRNKISIYNLLDEEYDNTTVVGTTEHINVSLILDCYKTPLVVIGLTSGDCVVSLSDIDRVIKAFNYAKVALDKAGYHA